MVPLNTRRTALLQETCQIGDHEELFTLAAAAADVGVWEYNPVDGYLYTHPVLLDMLGLSDREIPVSLDEWLRNVHPDDRWRARESTRLMIDGVEPQSRQLRRMLHRDGTIRYFLSRSMSLGDPSSFDHIVVGAEIDVTELFEERRHTS